MPKGKRKGKYEHKRTEQAYSSDEDAGIDMTIDNMSEGSQQSDVKSNHDEPVPSEPSLRRRGRSRHDITRVTIPEAPVENPNPNPNNWWQKKEEEPAPKKEKTDIEKLEEKVLELIDGLGARANAARATALVSLRAALQRRYLAGVLFSHRATLADHVSKALRRGRDGEKKAAAALAPLLALQIGEEGAEEFVQEVRPALVAAATDKSASLETRAEICSSLSLLCYLLEEDLSEILEVMRMFETIFSGSYLKGDGSVKVSGTVIEEGALHAAALDGWALLLPLLSPSHAASLLNNSPPSFAKLAELLEAVSLEVRMAAGGALAIAHERVTEESEDADVAAAIEALLPRLDELSRDSHKYRAKRDRKLQRATFRDILKYFEDDDVPSISVRVGTESVRCSSWAACAAYGAAAATLGGGLQALAPHCAPLRAALGLSDDPPPAMLPPQTKMNKLQRHLQNNAANKARTVARGKNRDKRSAALAI